MSTERPETVADVFQEVLDSRSMDADQREAYERRFSRALWLDRAEVMETMKGATNGG